MISFTLHKPANQCYGSLFPLRKIIKGNCDIKIEEKKIRIPIYKLSCNSDIFLRVVRCIIMRENVAITL